MSALPALPSRICKWRIMQPQALKREAQMGFEIPWWAEHPDSGRVKLDVLTFQNDLPLHGNSQLPEVKVCFFHSPSSIAYL